MLARTLILCAVAADASIDMSWLFPDAAPPPTPPSGGYDMSATFAKLRSCTTCTNAGYGWCPIRRKCGGFANKECGTGPQYFAEGAAAGQKESHSPPRKQQRGSARAQPPPSSGTDMRAVFAQLRTCDVCVGAGYGWCPMQRKCGGFANRECGVGERYVAEGEPVRGRSGIWKSKAERERESTATSKEKGAKSLNDDSMQPAEFSVPTASPPPPAEVLHAGDVQPPPTTEKPSAFVAVGVHAEQANETSAPVGSHVELTKPEQLTALSRAALEKRVLELQAELKMWREL